VRATTIVPLSAFEVRPAMVRIPFSLPVPAAGGATFERTRFDPLALLWGWIDVKDTEHAWEVRAAADAAGARYRARFRVQVSPLTPQPPYTPRAIVIPPSDKRPRPPASSV
jgi:hypothetical protein